MADSPDWAGVHRSPFVSSQPTSNPEDFQIEQIEFHDNTLNWGVGTTGPVPGSYGCTLPPSVHDHTHLINITPSFQSRISFGRSQNQHTQDIASIPALPQSDYMGAEMPQHPTQSPKSTNPSRGTELACPECPDRTFGRRAEKERHDNEQHRCSHPDCKGERFSVEQRELHVGSHGSMIEYNCGTCDLLGMPKSIFKRCDRLSKHFEAVHGVRKSNSKFQCLDRTSCYEKGLNGGLYFVSHNDLVHHRQLKHNVGGPSNSTADNGKEGIQMTSKHTGTLASGGSVPSERQGSLEDVLSYEFTQRDVSAFPTTQLQGWGAPSSNPTAIGYSYEYGDGGVLRLMHNGNNVVGVLFNWDQIDQVSIQAIRRNAGSQKQTLSATQLPADVPLGTRAPETTQSSLQRRWERADDCKQDNGTMNTMIEHAQRWNGREAMATAIPNLEVQRVHSERQSINHQSTLHGSNPRQHDTLQAMSHASHMRHASDMFQGQVGPYPPWEASHTQPWFSPMIAGGAYDAFDDDESSARTNAPF